MFFFPSIIFSQKYAVGLIPDSLLKNANAVIRNHHIEFEVQSPGRAIYREYRAVTIFNKKSYLNTMAVYYTPANKLSRIKGSIYGANGNLVRNLKKSEIKDQSDVAGYSVYEDDRYRYLEVGYADYPFTVEFEYEMVYKDLTSYPGWSLPEYNASVQQFNMEVEVPTEIELFHQELNALAFLGVQQTGSNKIYKWGISNFPAIIKEPYAPVTGELFPRIILSPSKFETEKYTGSMASWKDFGAFMYLLQKDRDKLTPTMKAKVKELTAGAATEKEKINILYKYMQENMRYVSVQLGIGGWQPFSAEYVEKNKYGDCKALSNFMKSMLKESGIQSYTVVVNWGDQPFDVTEGMAVPSAFNHMMLYVPSQDYWLECTSNTDPPNYIDLEKSDRNVLLVTEEGGKLMRTPKLTPEDNQEINQVSVELAKNGAATIQFESLRKGSLQEWHRAAKAYFSEEELKKKLQQRASLPSFTMENLKVKPDPDLPETTVSYTAQVPRYAAASGKRMFVPINAINAFSGVPPKDENRIHPVVVKNGYTESDLITIALPEHFHVESMPKELTELSSDYGEYFMKIKKEEGKVVIERRLKILPVRLPAGEYGQWRDFCKQLAKADAAKLVLVNE